MFPSRGIDLRGNSRRDYRSVKTFPTPPEFDRIKRLCYDPAKDVMYLGGTKGEHVNQHWKPTGPVVCRFDGRGKGVVRPTRRIVAPYVKGSKGHDVRGREVRRGPGGGRPSRRTRNDRKTAVGYGQGCRGRASRRPPEQEPRRRLDRGRRPRRGREAAHASPGEPRDTPAGRSRSRAEDGQGRPPEGATAPPDDGRPEPASSESPRGRPFRAGPARRRAGRDRPRGGQGVARRGVRWPPQGRRRGARPGGGGVRGQPDGRAPAGGRTHRSGSMRRAGLAGRVRPQGDEPGAADV